MLDARLPDGLYRVTTPTFCAGFVIRDGRPASCAPILVKGLRCWMRQSPPVLERVGPA